MSLSNYVGACANLARELVSSLTAGEIDAIHAALQGQKVIDWIRWRSENDGLVAEFVASTQKERLSKKKFQADRLYLTMAGAQLCLEGAALLRVVLNSMLVPGPSYRQMAATAGLAFGDVLSADIPYWPFAGKATPFVDDPGRDSAQDHL